ncbi:MAG: prolyl oligopeptidase family serine peptidase, partial [Thermodesulfobacteriota bacterium]
MVQDYYVERVRQISRERDEELRSIDTAGSAREYQRKVRKAIDRAFGPLPRKTPINPIIRGSLEKPGYMIERILFESRPGCLVTANLYIPRDIEDPVPGVLAPCGHAENGKALGLYQAFCQRLVASGFVVLIYDPFNQGERDQYHGLRDRMGIKGCCNAHNMMGKQLELLGEFFGSWRAWDGIRALDYLLTRPEVDSTRVGVTGNSGGGTMTEWLWALDDRFTMAAPSCFVNTFLSNLENELPQDCEQYPPGIMGAGLEMVDLMIARAPKPAMLLGQAYDYFDRRGLLKAYKDLKQFYEVLGEPTNVSLFIGPRSHGYYRENQEAMVNFFARHAGLSSIAIVEETEELNEETLFVTEKGNTIAAGSTPIYEFIAKRAEDLASRRKPVGLSLLRRRLRKILSIPSAKAPPGYRILRSISINERRFGRYAVETEGNIRAILKRLVAEDHLVNLLEVEDEVNRIRHAYYLQIARKEAELAGRRRYADLLREEAELELAEERERV